MEKRTDLRGLDARLAGLLGWTNIYEEEHGMLVGNKPARNRKIHCFVPYYSKNPYDMLELDAEMQRRGYSLAVQYSRIWGRWIAVYTANTNSFIDSGCDPITADTMPEAVARAAEAALASEKGAGK